MVTRPDRTSVGSRGATWTSLLEDWGITTDGKSQRNMQRRRRSRSNDIAAEMSGGAAAASGGRKARRWMQVQGVSDAELPIQR